MLRVHQLVHVRGMRAVRVHDVRRGMHVRVHDMRRGMHVHVLVRVMRGVHVRLVHLVRLTCMYSG